jgi:hypothetical protein
VRRKETDDERRARKLRMFQEERLKSAGSGSKPKLSKPKRPKTHPIVEESQPPRHNTNVNLAEFIGQVQRNVKRSALDD